MCGEGNNGVAYVYFNGERYFPVRDFDNDMIDLFNNRSSFYEVDELMPIPIAALNNKGYMSDMSCSGHGVGDFCCKVADEDSINKFKKESSLITVQYSSEYEADFMCWVGEQYTESFILFTKPEKFQNLPAGWQYKYNRLSCDFTPSNNPMSVYRQSATALEALMEWIDALPNRNGENNI